MADVTMKWQRSTYCADNACVEVAMNDDHVAMRNSKRADREPLVFTSQDWKVFVAWLRMTDIDR